jgi:ATP-dependent protease ClpP protease subunit
MSDDEEDDSSCDAIEVYPHVDPLLAKVEWAHDVKPLEIRIVGKIDEQIAADVEMHLRKAVRSGQSHVLLNLHSDGGSVYSALKIVDSLDACGLPVITCAKGNVESAAAVLFACGETRVISPNGLIMLHSVRGGSGKDTLSELQIDVRETERINRLLCEVLARATSKRGPAYYERLLAKNVDVNYSASEALQEGLATDIGHVRMQTHVRVETEINVVPHKKRKRRRLS